MTVEIYSVRVKPGSSRDAVEEPALGEIVVRVRARPVDGKANDAVVRLLAEHWGVPRSCVVIKSGAASRIKRVQKVMG